MAQQKQGGGKAATRNKVKNTSVIHPSDWASYKKTPNYLRGPKEGGLSLADQVRKFDQRKVEEARKADRRSYGSRWY